MQQETKGGSAGLQSYLMLWAEILLRTLVSREHRLGPPMLLSSAVPSLLPSTLKYFEMMALARLGSHSPSEESIKAERVSISLMFHMFMSVIEAIREAAPKSLTWLSAMVEWELYA